MEIPSIDRLGKTVNMQFFPHALMLPAVRYVFKEMGKELPVADFPINM
jgi:hypothetical protein